MDEDPRGLRERKKDATRRALAEHALALFGERGFDHVTVDDVARAAGVSPRTAFRYVAGKDDLLFTEDDAIAALVVAAVTAEPPGEPLDDVRAACRAFAAWCAPQRRVLRARDRVIGGSPALRTRERAKRAALEDGLAALLAQRHGLDPARDLRPRTWAALGLGCADAAYRLWLDRGGDLAGHLEDAFAATRG